MSVDVDVDVDVEPLLELDEIAAIDTIAAMTAESVLALGTTFIGCVATSGVTTSGVSVVGCVATSGVTTSGVSVVGCVATSGVTTSGGLGTFSASVSLANSPVEMTQDKVTKLKIVRSCMSAHLG